MKKGAWYVLSCFILWGLLPIYWKAFKEVNAVYILANRALWSFVFCGIIVIIRKEVPELIRVIKDRRTLLILTAAGFAVACNWGFYIYAIAAGHVLDGSMAYYMSPILAILLGSLVFKEKLSPRQWFAVFVVVVGVGYSIALYGKVPTFALIIGGSFAIYGALKKTISVKSEIALFIETTVMLPLAIGYIFYAQKQGISGSENLDLFGHFLLLLSGAITSIPLLFYAEGMKTTTLTQSGLLLYVNPTIQLFLGALVYKEEVTKANIVTFICIWIALVIYIPTIVKKKTEGVLKC